MFVETWRTQKSTLNQGEPKSREQLLEDQNRVEQQYGLRTPLEWIPISSIRVPFSHGTLLFNRAKPDHFTEADLTVATDRPGFTKVFSPTSIDLGETSTLTFTIAIGIALIVAGVGNIIGAFWSGRWSGFFLQMLPYAFTIIVLASASVMPRLIK